MEKKKAKLTISGNTKKTIDNIELAKLQNKNSVVIEKKNNRFPYKGTFRKPSTNYKPLLNKDQIRGNDQTKYKSKKIYKPVFSTTKDYEKRKLAEQRATKRLKGEELKSRIGSKKRELKLTVTRALDEETLIKTRSVASLKRAKLKVNKELWSLAEEYTN